MFLSPTKFSWKIIKYLLFVIVVLGLVLFITKKAQTDQKILISSLTNPKNFDKKITQQYLESLRINIPSHISLTNFYKSYGERLLGNEDIKIISREEWGADNEYADPKFIKNFCLKNYCYEDRYNPEDTFSEKEYWKSLELIINYRKNFETYDNFFLQNLKKENNLVYNYLPVEEIIIHHTAGKFTVNFEQSKKELQRIYLMQSVQRKWGDIGYHYLIDGAGRIYEGNLGGKYSVGIHTYSHNKGTLAIALMGDFRPNHDKLTEPMKRSLVNLIKYLIQEYQIDINQKEFYLRKKDLSGREMSKNIIKGHKELDIREKPTECPGIEPDYLRDLIYSSLNISTVY